MNRLSNTWSLVGLGSSNCPPDIICFIDAILSAIFFDVCHLIQKSVNLLVLEDVTQSTEILATAYLANIHIRPYNISI